MITFDQTIRRLKSLEVWQFYLLFVLLSEIFAAVLNSVQSILWWNYLSYDLLVIGSIDSLVISLIVSSVGVFLIRRDSELSALNQRLQLEINERKETEAALQKALENVKQLSGLLPMCASCRKIKDDKGYWESLELYIITHSYAEFSHGLCPECAKKLYPDIYIDE